MSEEKCKGECSECGGCNGCSEYVVLSCNPEISFVSTITFSARNFENCKAVRLVIECSKKDEKGECFAGVKYYKNGSLISADEEKYKIENSELICLNLDFEPLKDADKAEVKVFCKDGATLEIEHINVINVE